MRRTIIKEIVIPEGVNVSYSDRNFVAKGPKGEVSKKIFFPVLDIKIEENKVIVTAENAGKKEKKVIGTVASHIYNIIEGSNNGFIYKLKICSGHFPMNVSLSGDKLIVKNFLGEKVPRELILKKGPVVKVSDPIITVEGSDKELTSQVAADIEQLMRITNRDRRIFQDGIYITEKNGKVM